MRTSMNPVSVMMPKEKMHETNHLNDTMLRSGPRQIQFAIRVAKFAQSGSRLRSIN